MITASTPSLRGSRPRRGVFVLLTFFRRLAGTMFDAYHPERHYMRGPGPKWQAKHRQAPRQGER